MIRLKDLRKELRAVASAEDSLEGLRDAVVEQFEQMTGLLWNQRTGYVETSQIWPGQEVVFLSLRPVSSITSVEERRRSDTEYSELATSKYALDGHRLVRLDSLFWDGIVKVTYSGGYTETTCPADVRLALLKQAAFLTARTGNDKIAVKSLSRQGASGDLEVANYCPLFITTARSRARR